jgi:hypothetical protein
VLHGCVADRGTASVELGCDKPAHVDHSAPDKGR